MTRADRTLDQVLGQMLTRPVRADEGLALEALQLPAGVAASAAPASARTAAGV